MQPEIDTSQNIKFHQVTYKSYLTIQIWLDSIKLALLS